MSQRCRSATSHVRFEAVANSGSNGDELEGLHEARHEPTSLLPNCHRVENSTHGLTRISEVGWEQGVLRNIVSKLWPTFQEATVQKTFPCGNRCCRIVERVCSCIGLAYQSPRVHCSDRAAALQLVRALCGRQLRRGMVQRQPEHSWQQSVWRPKRIHWRRAGGL